MKTIITYIPNKRSYHFSHNGRYLYDWMIFRMDNNYLADYIGVQSMNRETFDALMFRLGQEHHSDQIIIDL